MLIISLQSVWETSEQSQGARDKRLLKRSVETVLKNGRDTQEDESQQEAHSEIQQEW